jgi:post-segregation antitoxin (ccd killing protein)
MSKNKTPCPFCGRAVVRRKLTLYVNEDLIAKARLRNLNFSKLMEKKLIDTLGEKSDE